MKSGKKPGGTGTKRSDAVRRQRQSQRFARILKLLELLQDRGAHRAATLANELGVSPRTIQRDLNVLSLAGINYSYDSSKGCFLLNGDYRFSVTGLTTDELIGQATATALTSAKGLNIGIGAKPTTQKLKATGRLASQLLLEDALRVTTVLDMKLADHEGHQEVIRVIQHALVEKRCLEGVYLSPYQKAEKTLVLRPIRLCLIKQAWYLIAQPDDAKHPVTYRVQRFRSMKKLMLSADVPDEFDLRAYFGDAWAVYRGSESHEVEVRFLPEVAALVAETIWHHTQQSRRETDGSVSLFFRVDGLEEIAWWVLGWSSVVEVIRPVELRKLVAERLRRALILNGR